MEFNHRNKLWILSVPSLVYSNDNRLSLKDEFEGLFMIDGENVQFHYFKTLSRVLVTYESEEVASMVHINLKHTIFHGTSLIIQQIDPFSIGSSNLTIPNKTHNFLISPPPSPPMGWEPIEEAPPIIDYNLIAAMSRLRLPGDPQLVYSGNETIPSIIVSSTEEDHVTSLSSSHCNHMSLSSLSPSLVQTTRPPNY